MAWRTCRKCSENFNDKKSQGCPICGEKFERYKQEEKEKIERQLAFEAVMKENWQEHYADGLDDIDSLIYNYNELDKQSQEIALKMRFIKSKIEEYYKGE